MEKRYSIGIVLEAIHQDSGGRAGIDFAAALASHGFSVTLYADEKYAVAQTVSMLEKKGVRIVLKKYSNSPLGMIARIRYLISQYKKNKHDIIINSGFFISNVASLFAKLPIITIYYGTQWNQLQEYLPLEWYWKVLVFPVTFFFNVILYFKTALVLHGSDEIISISHYCKKELRIFGIFGAKVVPFAPGMIPLRKNEKSEVFTVLSVSRLTPYKNFHNLISVFIEFQKENPESQLIIIGSAQNKKYKERLLKLIPENVPIKIIESPDDYTLSEWYSRCDVYVGYDRYLFFGLPVTEAGLFAKPALAFNRCAAPERVLHGKTGYVFDNNAQLLFYLTRLYHAPLLREELGNAHKKHVEAFRWELVMKGIISSIQKVSYIRMRNVEKNLIPKLILAIGIFLRIISLFKQRIWFDEAATLRIAQQPLDRIPQMALSDNSPPLFHLVWHLFMQLFPQFELLLRFPSFLLGIVTLYLCKILFEKVTSSYSIRNTALLFVSLSPALVALSGEIKNTVLLVPLSILATIFFVCALSPQKILQRINCILVLTIIGLTHHYGVIISVSFFCMFFLITKKFKQSLLFLIPMVLSIFQLIWAQKLLHPKVFNYPPPKNILATFYQLLSGPLVNHVYENKFYLIWICLGALVVAILIFRSMQTIREDLSKYIIQLNVLFILLPFFVSFFFPLYSVTPFAFLVPAFALFLAWALEEVPFSNYVKLYLGIFFCINSLVIFLSPNTLDNKIAKVNDSLSQKKPECIFHHSHYSQIPMNFYFPNVYNALPEVTLIHPFLERSVQNKNCDVSQSVFINDAFEISPYEK